MLDKALVKALREQKVWLVLEPRVQAFLKVSAHTTLLEPCSVYGDDEEPNSAPNKST